MKEPKFEPRLTGSKVHTLNHYTHDDIPLPREIWKASKRWDLEECHLLGPRAAAYGNHALVVCLGQSDIVGAGRWTRSIGSGIRVSGRHLHLSWDIENSEGMGAGSHWKISLALKTWKLLAVLQKRWPLNQGRKWEDLRVLGNGS